MLQAPKWLLLATVLAFLSLAAVNGDPENLKNVPWKSKAAKLLKGVKLNDMLAGFRDNPQESKDSPSDSDPVVTKHKAHHSSHHDPKDSHFHRGHHPGSSMDSDPKMAHERHHQSHHDPSDSHFHRGRHSGSPMDAGAAMIHRGHSRHHRSHHDPSDSHFHKEGSNSSHHESPIPGEPHGSHHESHHDPSDSHFHGDESHEDRTYGSRYSHGSHEEDDDDDEHSLSFYEPEVYHHSYHHKGSVVNIVVNMETEPDCPNATEPVAPVSQEWVHAKCALWGAKVKGTVWFRQKGYGPLEIKRKLKGFSKAGEHGFHVHQFGDDHHNCSAYGGHFNPDGHDHSHAHSHEKHAGDLGNLKVNAKGRVKDIFTVEGTSLNGPNSIVGRGIVVHGGKDDLGKGDNQGSLAHGNAGPRVACCVIGWTQDPGVW